MPNSSLTSALRHQVTCHSAALPFRSRGRSVCATECFPSISQDAAADSLASKWVLRDPPSCPQTWPVDRQLPGPSPCVDRGSTSYRSEEHTSELQSLRHL